MSFIECDNIVKIYKVADLEVVALQGVDLRLERGEMTAIIGTSGSGKSTLMNILGGLDKPSAGRIAVGAYNLTRLKKNEQVAYRRSEVGFVWQQTARNLVPYLTAKQNVELPMALNNLGRKERERRAIDLLEQVGLGDRLNYLPRKLSGGQQQRVAIAVAMANQPTLLLADEPTGQVDSEAADAIFSAMTLLNQQYGVTILIVTHDTAVAERVERVIGMRDGRIISEVNRQVQVGEEREFAILDRGGRLQLPQAFIEALALQEKVALELLGDHIGVYPAGEENR